MHPFTRRDVVLPEQSSNRFSSGSLWEEDESGLRRASTGGDEGPGRPPNLTLGRGAGARQHPPPPWVELQAGSRLSRPTVTAQLSPISEQQGLVPHPAPQNK